MNVSAEQAVVLPLMMGVPDNRLISVSSRGAGAPLAYHFLGNSRIATNLAPRFKQRLLRIFFGPDMPIHLPNGAHGLPLINAVAHPDISSIALRMLEQFIAESDVGCFNHPVAVLGLGRDGIATKLKNLAGVHMPRTARVRIDEPDDLNRIADESGLAWPLIVRVAGSHRGAATVKIDEPGKIRAALRGLAWGGHDLYLTQYVECRDQDGYYRKLRVVVVGGEVFLRHLVIADGWLVHVHDRLLGHLQEETATLADFRGGILPELRDRLHAIADAVDMDYFGIDCNLRPDGRLLVFEVNAMMDILNNTMASPNCWDEPIRQIHDALGALLFEPTRWRHPGEIPAPIIAMSE
ncbi:MAG: hypothetical protein ABI132_01770 [Rhodanobacteraceae bacterium]